MQLMDREPNFFTSSDRTYREHEDAICDSAICTLPFVP